MHPQLDLESKGQDCSKNQKTMPQDPIKLPSPKNEQGLAQ